MLDFPSLACASDALLSYIGSLLKYCAAELSIVLFLPMSQLIIHNYNTY